MTISKGNFFSEEMHSVLLQLTRSFIKQFLCRWLINVELYESRLIKEIVDKSQLRSRM